MKWQAIKAWGRKISGKIDIVNYAWDRRIENFLERNAGKIVVWTIIVLLFGIGWGITSLMKAAVDATVALTSLTARIIDLEKEHQQQRESIKVLRIQNNTNEAMIKTQLDSWEFRNRVRIFTNPAKRERAC